MNSLMIFLESQKKWKSLSLLAIFLGLLVCCTEGKVSQSDRSSSRVLDTLESFYIIEYGAPCTLEIVQDPVQKIIFTGADSLVDDLSITVSKGKLRIESTDRGGGLSSLGIRIQSPGIQGIFSIKTGDIRIEGEVLNREDATIVSRGSGDVEIEGFDREKLTILHNGSGNVSVQGRTEMLKLIGKGSGEVRAEKCTAAHVMASLKGSGDFSVHAVDMLDAKIYGSGNVIYSGSPKVDKVIQGTGEVRRE